MSEQHNTRIADLRKEMYALRNGIISDTLRKAGQPYKVIFGLQIPQLAQIARTIGYDNELADHLWAATETRECRLLACYLYDPSTVDKAKILELCSSILTQEEADMLTFRLIKRHPAAQEIYETIKHREHPDSRLLRALKAHLDD